MAPFTNVSSAALALTTLTSQYLLCSVLLSSKMAVQHSLA